MIITPNGTLRVLTVAEHLQRKTLVYQDHEYSVELQPNKYEPFLVKKGQGKQMYIDFFALHFGQKERLRRKVARGWIPIHYGCSRATRDAMFCLTIEDVFAERANYRCPHRTCQYWSKPTGLKGYYAFNCILLRYRALGVIDLKCGLTLEEVSRIYGCTRERIRQIQEQAMQRMRHHTRASRIDIFREHIADYRDYLPETSAKPVSVS